MTLTGQILEQGVLLTIQGAEQERFSSIELRAQKLAGRQAKKQLMQVPWDRFHKAYEEYPEWLGLSLWGRVLVTARGNAPSKLLKTLRERCPGFLETEVSIHEPNLLAFRLLEWVHRGIFACARQEGWLDALNFYGVRHMRSRAVWAYWEHCDDEWKANPPKAAPSFGEWRRCALGLKICGDIRYSAAALSVEKYIDWEATTHWVRPLLSSHSKVPTHVACELERRIPRSCYGVGSMSEENQKNSVSWRAVLRRLIDTEVDGRLDVLTDWTRFHPRHVRLMAYGRHWTKVHTQNQGQMYPSFRQWQRDAMRYTME